MPLPVWSIYKLAAKRRWLGIVETLDATAAIEAAAKSSRRMRGGCLRWGNGEPPAGNYDPPQSKSPAMNREVIFCAAGVLAALPLTYFMCRDDSDLVVFCIAYPEYAGAFAKHFGGRRLPRGNNARPARVDQDERKVQNM
jgi:hypothetical protein